MTNQNLKKIESLADAFVDHLDPTWDRNDFDCGHVWDAFVKGYRTARTRRADAQSLAAELESERARSAKLIEALQLLRPTVVARSQMNRIDNAIAEYEASRD